MATENLFTCPVCKSGNVVEVKKFLSRNYHCEQCGTRFNKVGNTYSLGEPPGTPDQIETYYELRHRFGRDGKPEYPIALTADEWTTIADGGKSQGELEAEEVQRQIEKEQEYLETLQSGDFSQLPKPTDPPVMLKKGEEALISMPHGVDLYEERVRHEYQGGSAGFSFRVAKGVSFRVGGFKGQRVPVTEQKHIDSGALVITNKRVIFNGPSKSTSFATNKIINVEVYDDGIRINREGKQKPEYFLASISIEGFQYRSPWMMVKAVIEGTLQV